MLKKIRYFIEAAILYLAFFVFRLMPAHWASNIGGWMGRTIGPRLAASRKAERNIRAALPEKTDDDVQKIIRDMWDNLGRVIAEYPHLETICKKHITIEGTDNLEAFQAGSGGVMISAHLANWEIGTVSFLLNHNLQVDPLYRAPNNPWSDKLLDRCRSLNGRLSPIPKSRSGVRQLMKALQDKRIIGILIDQKYNEGISIPFFERPAMTSPAFVQLAQKFDCPLIPVRARRLDGCRFHITVYPAIKTKDRITEEVIEESHAMLETWIREQPGQWLWLHRRWDSKAIESETHETL